MKIATVIAAVIVAFGYLSFRVIEYVTAIEAADRIMMGDK